MLVALWKFMESHKRLPTKAHLRQLAAGVLRVAAKSLARTGTGGEPVLLEDPKVEHGLLRPLLHLPAVGRAYDHRHHRFAGLHFHASVTPHSMKILPRLDKPCSQDWEKMTGDDRRRFCEHCQLHVHNLSAMTEREQVTLLSRKTERACITYIDSTDVLHVRTGSWLALQRFALPLRSAALLMAGILPAFFTGCTTSTKSTEPPPPSPPAMHQHAADDDGKRTMGLPAYYPPLWQRILMFWKY